MGNHTFRWITRLVGLVALLILAACGAPTADTAGSEAEAAADHSHSSEEAAGHSHSEGSGEAGEHSHGETFEIPHIHGLGFRADGKQLLIPAHIGMYTVSDGTWARATGPQHDYMGFAISDDGFYSSGHPAPTATDLANPLGLVKSTDGGSTLQQLGFAGESDFHLMAVGYNSHAIYVINSAQNSKLAPGLHYSLDDGATWTQSALGGVATAPLAIAVHPTEPQIVALATEQGVLLSSDHGDTFAPIGDGAPAVAVAFDRDGNLLFGTTALFRYDLQSQQTTNMPAPPLVEDEYITYVAASPADPNVMAVATSKLNLFQSNNAGEQWKTLASDGVGLNGHED